MVCLVSRQPPIFETQNIQSEARFAAEEHLGQPQAAPNQCKNYSSPASALKGSSFARLPSISPAPSLSERGPAGGPNAQPWIAERAAASLLQCCCRQPPGWPSTITDHVEYQSHTAAWPRQGPIPVEWASSAPRRLQCCLKWEPLGVARAKNNALGC